ncbi:hypothetical protein AB4K20DRAFT_1923302 [Rhizopus microsporus]
MQIEQESSLIFFLSFSSECHSCIIKSLERIEALSFQQKNVKLDFIFTYAAGLNDGFFCDT